MQKSLSKRLVILGILIGFVALFSFILSSVKTDQNHEQIMRANMGSNADGPKQVLAAEKKFLRSMIPHHEEAVETSKFVLSQTKDAELHAFLTKVIAAQLAEIEQMKSIYKTLTNEDYKQDGQYEPMMGELRSLSGLKLEKFYVRGMIAHHQGAISMAQNIVLFGERSSLTPFAQGIIDAQTSEVAMIQSWLEGKYKNVQLDDIKPVMPMMMH